MSHNALSIAFDVVPNQVETPRTLTMQLSTGRFDISRDAMLADAHRFGFKSKDKATHYLDSLLVRIASSFNQVARWLDAGWQEALHARLQQNLAVLS